MACEPCAACGAAKAHAHVVICDTCNRPYHLQCCHPPRSIVPAGDWHCHLCDEAYRNLDEIWREDTVLFARPSDVFDSARQDLLHEYVRRSALGAQQARDDANAAGVDASQAEQRVSAFAAAASALPADLPRES